MSGSSVLPAGVARFAPTVVFGRLTAQTAQHITAITEGRNPHVRFQFKELRLPRGYVPHCPHTDLFEIRPSVTIQFLGTPWGEIVVHMFHDGTIKTKEEMYAEASARAQENARLTAEESAFPALGQTAARKQALDRMLQRIRELRDDKKKSIISKQVEKTNAESEYRAFLEMQAEARRVAAAEGRR